MQDKADNDEALREALQTAAEMSHVMERSVAASFHRTGVRLFAASYIGTIGGMFLSTIVAGAMAASGLIVAAEIVLAAGLCCIGASLFGLTYDFITSRPSHQFSVASRALQRAASRVPDSAKRMFQQFNKRANAMFALAHAASAQKRIIDGREDSRALFIAEDEADLSLKKRLDGLEMSSRIDFRERKLPRAEVFRQEFCALSTKLEENLKNLSVNADNPLRVEPKHAA